MAKSSWKRWTSILLSCVLLCILCACAKQSGGDSPPQEPNDDPRSGLEKDIVGMWDHTSEDGWHRAMDFTPDGRVLAPDDYMVYYQVASEHTIILTLDGQSETLRIIECSDDKLIIEENGGRTEYTRTRGNPNLKDDIIGLWVAQNDEYWMFEFTEQGLVLDSYYGFGTYSVASDHSVVIQDSDQEDYVMRIGDVSGDTLKLGWADADGIGDATFMRVKGHPNLGKDLVGMWKSPENGLYWEFTESGKVIDHSFGDVMPYRVLSDTTFSIGSDDEEMAAIVLDISPSKLVLVGFGESFEDSQTLLKEK